MNFMSFPNLAASILNMAGVRCFEESASHFISLGNEASRKTALRLGKARGDVPDFLGRAGVGDDENRRLSVFDDESEGGHEMIDRDRREPKAVEFERLMRFDRPQMKERRLGVRRRHLDEVGPDSVVEQVAMKAVEDDVGGVDRHAVGLAFVGVLDEHRQRGDVIYVRMRHENMLDQALTLGVLVEAEAPGVEARSCR